MSGFARAEDGLPPDAARELNNLGFTVLPGPSVPGGLARLAEACDRAVSAAAPEEEPEFAASHLHGPLLMACRRLLGRPLELGCWRVRTLEPGAPEQPLQVDLRRGADSWPRMGFLLMIDDFRPENGALRFVPGSHWLSGEALEACGMAEPACGPAGSLLVFHGAAWHGHGANRTASRCRWIQGAFLPRASHLQVPPFWLAGGAGPRRRARA